MRSNLKRLFRYLLLLGLIIGITNSAIASADVGGTVTEPFSLEVIAETGDVDPPPDGAGGGGDPGPTDPCDLRSNEPVSWLPASVVTPGPIFPSYSGSVYLPLGFQQGWDCATETATSASGGITTAFEIDGQDWYEGSTCDVTAPCTLPGTIFDLDPSGRVYGTFEVPNNATSGTYSGTFSVTWTP